MRLPLRECVIVACLSVLLCIYYYLFVLNILLYVFTFTCILVYKVLMQVFGHFIFVCLLIYILFVMLTFVVT